MGCSAHLLVCVVPIGLEPWFIACVDTNRRVAGLRERVVAKLRLVDVIEVSTIRFGTVLVVVVTGGGRCLQLLLEGVEVERGFFLARLLLLLHVREVEVVSGDRRGLCGGRVLLRERRRGARVVALQIEKA